MSMRYIGLALRGLCLAVVLTAAGLGQSASPAPPATAVDAAVVKDFEARVTKYMDLRKKQAGSAPKPTNSADKLTKAKEDIGAKIRAARADAREGDIFSPEIAAYFRKQIAATLSGPHGKRIQASLRHAEPIAGLAIKVNDKYPEGVALQSTPPSLLLNLPPLPKELEYRIVDSALILRDITPNLIVDVLRDAIHTPQ